EQTRQLHRRHSRAQKIGTADVANEKRVSGQYANRHRIRLCKVENKNADGFGCMSWRFDEAQPDSAHGNFVAVMHANEIEFYPRLRAEINSGSCPRGQFVVTRDEVRMTMGFDHMFDGETLRFCILQVNVDVTLRINNCGFTF